jgi:acetyl esterase
MDLAWPQATVERSDRADGRAPVPGAGASVSRRVARLASAVIVCFPSAVFAAAGSPLDGATAGAGTRAATPSGAVIELIEEHPVGAGPFPAVVLASGSGYDMRQPILERVAHALVAAGVGVIRFDWAYHVRDPQHGQQSADRAAEIEDLTTALALARKAPWVDPRRIAVGGKSLGSIIAWRVLRQEPDLRGALLLTPVCSPKPSDPPSSPIVDGNYPGLRAETRPTAWILGKADPACATSVLYQYLANAGGGTQVDVLRGDHTFSEGSRADRGSATAVNERSLDLVARLSADFATSVLTRPQAEGDEQPRSFEYVRRGSTPLHLYVFSPAEGTRGAAAILLFHSGGWTRSRPQATFEQARRFATAGLVAIPVEYRLSTGAVTPVEAFDDTCEAFRWVRAHAGEIGVDPKRVAGYGASAGGVMVAAAATAGCPSAGPGNASRTTDARPEALVLVSTGFDLERSETFRKLARPDTNPADYSPLAHLTADLPPTFVAQGSEDSVTPLAAATTFCARARSLGRTCELQIYPGLGHLLTRNLADQRNRADPDPQAAGDALDRQLRFLSSLGFTSAVGASAATRAAQ